jgi:hypothetical protein
VLLGKRPGKRGAECCAPTGDDQQHAGMLARSANDIELRGSSAWDILARLMKLKAGKKLEPYEIIGPLVNWVEELKQRVPGR